MQRNKTIAYEDDDLYDDGDDYEEEQIEEYTEEDKQNFATLTPVVRAEIEEAGLQASDRDIGDALWNYYWDVAKSVAYLKNVKRPKGKGDGGGEGKKEGGKGGKGKVKGSRFDQAAEKNLSQSGGGVGGELECSSFSSGGGCRLEPKEGAGSRYCIGENAYGTARRRGGWHDYFLIRDRRRR